MDDSSLIIGGMTSQVQIDIDIDIGIDISIEDIFVDVESHRWMKQMQQAISQTLESAGHVANLMPTGSLLAFLLISPILSSQGQGDWCGTFRRAMTAGVVALCGLSSVLLHFTDSLKCRDGNVCHGLATFRGLWMIFDASVTLPPNIATKFKLRFIDFVHAFLSCLVFAAAIMFDQNVVNCFYPSPAIEEKEVFTALPLGIGVICSILFLLFPTKRRGIGFSVTHRRT